MRKLIMTVLLLSVLIVPVNAMEFTAPAVPESGEAVMPSEPETFGQGLLSIIREAVALLQPSISSAAGICLQLIVAVTALTLLNMVSSSAERTVQLTGAVLFAIILLEPTNTLIQLGLETVKEISEYGKLLIPVLTAALAAQGGPTSSAALYSGTVFFNGILGAMLSHIVGPLIYIYICMSVAHAAINESLLTKLKDLSKWLMTWGMKIILYVFTGYMGITGVVSGTTDAAALKAAKLTISGVVPVVGGILSDASEAVLVGAGIMKNAVGVYGLLAVLAVWVGPFIKIGTQYLLLKATAAICGVLSDKAPVKLIQDFSGAMGFVLAMTATVSLFLLISIVCFMKGVGA